MEENNIQSIFINGSFDLLHIGHFNILRQAKTRFPHARLVVGIHPPCPLKGKSVYSIEEKELLLSKCDFVDQVIMNVP